MDAALTAEIRAAHAASKGTYGAPRLQIDLAEAGIRVSRKRVARLMLNAGLVGVSRRKSAVTTVRDGARQAPDLVDRNFTADQPNRLWVADITYIPTWGGFLYLAVVLDAFSRRIVGWSMATTLHMQVVLDALNMALWQRRPSGVIHHSDHGSQYTSIEFGKRCREAGVRPSMGSVGDAYDNAMAESFFATLECELLDRCRFKTQAEARMAVFQFIEGFYNPRRRHSSLGYLSPIAFERQYAATALEPGAHSMPSCSRLSRAAWKRRSKLHRRVPAVRDGHRHDGVGNMCAFRRSRPLVPIHRDHPLRTIATSVGVGCINQSISSCTFLLTGHPCANCKTTQKKSGFSTKNHRSNMPPDSAFTYGLINKGAVRCIC